MVNKNYIFIAVAVAVFLVILFVTTESSGVRSRRLMKNRYDSLDRVYQKEVNYRKSEQALRLKANEKVKDLLQKERIIDKRDSVLRKKYDNLNYKYNKLAKTIKDEELLFKLDSLYDSRN